MPFLICDNSYTGEEAQIVDTIDEVIAYFNAEEVSERGSKYEWPDVYEIVRKVEMTYDWREVRKEPEPSEPASATVALSLVERLRDRNTMPGIFAA